MQSNLLGYFVAKVAADADERERGAEPELAQAEVGAAVAAGVMPHGEFADAEAGGDGDRGQERLHEIDGEKRVDDFAAEDAQLASAIVQTVVEQAAPDGVAKSRDQPTDGRVVAIDAPATGEIKCAGGDGRVERGEIAGIVLAIAIHGEDQIAARGAQAVEQRGGLAEVSGVSERVAFGPARTGGGDFRGGRVGAAVVDEDDFKRRLQAGEHGHGAREEREEVAGFIIDRHDERVAWVAIRNHR